VRWSSSESKLRRQLFVQGNEYVAVVKQGNLDYVVNVAAYARAVALQAHYITISPCHNYTAQITWDMPWQSQMKVGRTDNLLDLPMRQSDLLLALRHKVSPCLQNDRSSGWSLGSDCQSLCLLRASSHSWLVRRSMLVGTCPLLSSVSQDWWTRLTRLLRASHPPWTSREIPPLSVLPLRQAVLVLLTCFREAATVGNSTTN